MTGIIPKKSAKFYAETKHNQQKELSKLRHEEEELIDEIGQESETKALRPTQEYVKELQEQDAQRQLFFKEALHKAIKDKKLYQRKLIFILQEFVKEEYIPEQYKMYVHSTDEGIVFGVTGTDLSSAIAVSGMPKYDIHAARILALRLGNTIARMEGHMRESSGGLYIANEKELEIMTKYGRQSR